MRWSNFFHIYQPPAWDEAIIRRATDEAYLPFIHILQSHPDLRVTLNITGSLTEQLLALGLTSVIDGIRSLAERGQIELVGSAMYHPILPLLPSDEVVRQITLQTEYYKKVFGSAFAPKGFYCPEMAYGPDLDDCLLAQGFAWVIVDEIALDGIGRPAVDHGYRSPSGLLVLLRNRFMSDFLAFRAGIDQPKEAAQAIRDDARSQRGLVTAMDGENLGHHRHGVDRLWGFLVTQPDIETLTLSEFLAVGDTPVEAHPRASSWASQESEMAANIPYGLWKHPSNPIHALQWRLTHTIIEAVKKATADPQFATARRLLDQGLTSDKYWWASASPWWDTTIIIRETQKLADVIAPLTTVTVKTRNEVERLMQQLTTTVELWEKTGLAKQRQTTYLSTSGNVHFLGGQRVS
ncbi:MAG: hypothetical protein HY092_00645 [Candidatus Kerfeldbacteria bacterium]|nr:hypothetical protein [Candidatus Kerfeldbacteria bacterium]